MPPQTLRNTDTHTVNDNTIGLPMSVGSVHNSDIYLAPGFATVWQTLYNTENDIVSKDTVDRTCLATPFTTPTATVTK